MAVGLSQEQRALAASVRDWCEGTASRKTARDLLDRPAATLPQHWHDPTHLDFLGVHLPERLGGGGGTAADLAVVSEELAYGAATGAFSAAAVASLLVDVLDGVDEGFVRALASGSAVVGIAAAGPELRRVPGGAVLSGTVSPVLAGAVATHLLVPVEIDGSPHLALVEVGAGGVGIRPVPSLSPGAQLAEVTFGDVQVDDAHLVAVEAGLLRRAVVTALSAEAAGIAGWCLDAAAEHARTRVQFGRVIGGFQAVKHLCAQMLVSAEQARALAWDAAQTIADPEQGPLAAAAAGALVFDAAVECANSCIQIHGGMGFAWEHDAHLYLRHALLLRQLAGEASAWRAELVALASAGGRRRFSVELADERPETRSAAADAAARAAATPSASLRQVLADEGYLAPHWPSPWGRDADALDQLVIAEEFAAAGVRVPPLLFENWVLPTIITHGSAEQQERFVGPTLRGEISWCQLFSEPGAGSDLASLRTSATAVDGGWRIDGQKVWTSMAQYAQWAICLARTNPSAPKHEGITYFLVDMTSPGVTVRPLRDISGDAHFNEVFLDEVFVPHECVVGDVDGGWPLARNTLSNERVALTTGSTLGFGAEAVLQAARDAGRLADPVVADRVGAFLAEGQAQAVLALRATLAQLSGTDPGPMSSVRKLMGMEHQQAAMDFEYQLLGPTGAALEGQAAVVALRLLLGRSLTIAGGTTQVLRNVVAERILGLPRDDDQ